MGRHARPKEEQEAELHIIPTQHMADYLNQERAVEQSRFDNYYSNLLMRLSFCEDEFVQVVFDLHSPDSFTDCLECSRVSDDEISWPCLTMQRLGEKAFSVYKPVAREPEQPECE